MSSRKPSRKLNGLPWDFSKVKHQIVWKPNGIHDQRRSRKVDLRYVCEKACLSPIHSVENMFAEVTLHNNIELSKNGQKMPKIVQKIPNIAKNCPKLLKIAQNCPKLPKIDENFSNILKNGQSLAVDGVPRGS